MSDAAVADATGRDWNQWVEYIEAWDGDLDDHAAVAAYLLSETDLDGWWSQTVTVGFERITGRRMPYQRADGTFAATKSKVVAVPEPVLRQMLLDEGGYRELFAGQPAALRSGPGAKAIRIEVGVGVAVFGLAGRTDGTTKVTIAHEKLPTYESVAESKSYWTRWLGSIGDTG